MTVAGCAKHADFVEVREDLHAVTRSQEQMHKQQEAVQRRLQAVESKLSGDAGKDAGASKPQTEELLDRLKVIEGRLANLESALRPMPAKPDGAAGEPPRQSKPAAITPRAEPMLPLPGTPDISPTSAYNLAYNDYLNGRYELAVAGFQRFLHDFPSTSLAPNAQYWLGESYYSMKDHVRAMQAFEKVVADHPHSEKVAAALYKLGLASAETGNATKAREYLKRVLQDYKDSNEAKLAKGKLAELR
ncbi:MAG: tol-pal system protein YbgF [Nitrospirae bacterium RIFCSPLOWO2_01_FULL_62_17]|nr:MAG: tol-pal system protein YbgF [Nitrospirae bacterium RIFCSPLOWO2_01_FULL_62_17]